jgi:hypothetical protein
MSWFRKKEDDASPSLPTAAELSGGMGGAAGASPAVSAMTENFLTYTTQLNSVTALCWEKCAAKKSAGELTVGEMSCDDRCVLKYLATTTKVAELFQGLMMGGQQPPPME